MTRRVVPSVAELYPAAAGPLARPNQIVGVGYPAEPGGLSDTEISLELARMQRIFEARNFSRLVGSAREKDKWHAFQAEKERRYWWSIGKPHLAGGEPGPGFVRAVR